MELNASNGSNGSNSSGSEVLGLGSASQGLLNRTMPTCKCGQPTDVLMAVVWKSTVNLTKEATAS